MNMDFNLSISQEQKLIMTQQMQLSVKILQLSSYELQKLVEKETQENPLLDIKYTDNKKDNTLDYKEIIKYLEFDNYNHSSFVKNDNEEVSPFTFISEKKSLKEYLIEQIRDIDVKDSIKLTCYYIVENIDERGYLGESLKDISKELKISIEDVERSLKLVQTLEPDGIAARDLKECLKIQCRKKGIIDEKLYLIIEKHLEDIAENRYNLIAKNLNVNVREAQKYGDFIKTLQPKPSRGFYTGEETKYILPDAYIKKIDDKYHIIMNDDLMPRLTINNLYKGIINKEEDKNAVEYVKNRLDSATFLIRSIEHRKSTIYKVLEKIIELQREYFDYGENFLKPMTLKEIADSLDMHESTISRAVRDKYIYTDRGTIKIKDLFTTGLAFKGNSDALSSKEVKRIIEELIQKEDKKNPLSDQIISDILQEKGVNISRRTVAKYREEMGIKSSKGRKRY
ncbi:RNA polymerase sigma-54 factor [Clostridium tetanomorphum]|uniref:RNA polymerase factor sigma-54 n=2 Tax=Clostridium tetanomorphum TaxID=1553 RepID=A0A923J2L7_CLOTT|nr:RNA polymerase factor sigma-54 [Clostridium tetanomorphum DSM 665]MBC2398708.1 RNA polymerase factor sigma-54 [Clostridium tetanomorphum]MBP1865789.1 RNA polymerase sigma-54 factor [Clostridium tetanomorphum]NRS86910.1 RNA polymerase sigma-54 factor [Clostridium tetanomorphum]NRZ99332.1 RNA polymerase sigma-54 factor [Clostridium tetanomorphum]